MAKKLKEGKDFVIKPKEQAFWEEVVSARKLDLQTAENNARYYAAILKAAEHELKKAKRANR